jgi:hypothetical protein
MFIRFFFAYFLVYLPLLFSALLLLIIIVNYFFDNRKCLLFLKKIDIKKSIYALIIGTIFFDLLLSALQYVTWSSSPFSRLFLPPYQSINYFLGYITLHFWSADILALIFSFFIFLFLKLIKKYRTEIISREELMLVLFGGLLVGWPRFVIWLPLFLVIAVIVSIANLLIFKKNNISLFFSIILSLIIVLIFGNFLINNSFLAVLSI